MMELTEGALAMSDDLEFKDDGYIELVLRVLGLMCDNQHKGLQVHALELYFYHLFYTNPRFFNRLK